MAPLRVRKSGVALTVLAVALAVGLFAVDASAQATVKVHFDRATIAEDDTLTVRVVASGSYDELVAPRSQGFDFEQNGRSSQVSIIGSQMQRSDTYTYTARPRRVGKHRIDGAILRHRGRDVATSQAVVVEVKSARAALGAALTPEEALDMRRYRGEAFFVRPQLSAMHPFAGQPFVLMYELYWSRRVHVANIAELGGPKYVGFELEDLLSGKPQQQEPATFGGVPFFRQVTRKVLLTAAVAGTFEVLGPRYRVEAGDMFSTRGYKVGPPPLKIEVRPLPAEGRPSTYRDGNVGKLELDGWLLQKDRPVLTRAVQVGERVVLHVQVQGSGNLYGVTEVPLPALPGMTVEPLPSRPDDHVQVSAAGSEGKRVWQYVLTFAAPGRFELPALHFACFDPFDEQYRESTAGPFVIEVQGQAAVAPAARNQAGHPAGAAPPSSAEKPGLQGLSHADTPISGAAMLALRPIAAQASLARAPGPAWTSSRDFWRLAAVPWAVALLLVMLRVGLSVRARGGGDRRSAGALRTAQAALEAAQSAGGAEAYGALRAAVVDYLQARANIHMGGLTFSALRGALRRHQCDPACIDTLIETLEHCDFARFAPTDDRAADVEQTAGRLAEVLARLDADLAAAATPHGAGTMASVLLLLAMCAAPVAHAATLDQGFSAANKAFVAGDFEGARAGYEELLRHDLQAAAIHYNLANTLVRLDRLGEAVGHYQQALRDEPGEELKADALANLTLCRQQLAERARRRHRILHIFDESADADVALARAAPRDVLGVLTLFAGFVACALFAMLLFSGRFGAPTVGRKALLIAALAAHFGAAGWLGHAHHVDETVRYGVVIKEDAPLSPCVGVGETVDLPEGLEVRALRTRPDGRAEVRLPNGRRGCMDAAAVYMGSSLGRS